jgi:hypothetical protein
LVKDIFVFINLSFTFAPWAGAAPFFLLRIISFFNEVLIVAAIAALAACGDEINSLYHESNLVVFMSRP